MRENIDYTARTFFLNFPKMEQHIINGFYNAMCSTCLSTDRDLFSVNEMHGAYQMFKIIMNDFVCHKYANVTIEMDDLFCWECLAHLNKIARFKIQVHSAQESLRELVMNWSETGQGNSLYKSLSSLEPTTITGYDNIYLHEENSKRPQCVVLGTGYIKNKDFKEKLNFGIKDEEEDETNTTEMISESQDTEVIDTDTTISTNDDSNTCKNKRKRNYVLRSDEQIQDALAAIKSGKSIRQVAIEHQIPCSTLKRRSKKRKCTRVTQHHEYRKVFDSEQELALCDYYKTCALMFYGLTTTDCRKIAYDMAKLKSIQIPGNWDRYKIAGIDWFRGFSERYPDMSLLAKPENCLVEAFNKETVEMFFENLENALRNLACADGTRIFNLDELHVDANCIRGKMPQEETLLTTCNIISAGGIALPPVLVFASKGVNPHMGVGTPPNSLILASPTGCMTSEIFTEVMEHFIQSSGSTKDDPTLLIMDNHESHLSLVALDLAKEFGVTVVTLPQTLEKLQPLVHIHGPFKDYYATALESYTIQNPESAVSIYDVGKLVCQAFEKAMTSVNIINSFQKTGIYPFDRDAEDDFV